MKKFLLSLAAVFAIGSTAMAETATITFSDKYSANTTLTDVVIDINDDVTVTFAKGTGQTAPQYYASGTAVRWYGGNTMTVAAKTSSITKIEIVFGDSDGTNVISANTGTFESPNWTGSSSSVVFTEAGTSGNRRIAGLNVTYGEDGGTTDPDPDPVDPTPNPDGEEMTVTYDSTSKGYANAQEISTVEEGDVTIEFNKGSNSNTPKYYTSGTAVRVYGGGYFTVSVPEGDLITSITLTYGGSPGTNAITTDPGTFDTQSNEWTGSSQSVKFTIGGTSGNRQIKAITVVYTKGEAPAVAAPKITCENNEVTITCATVDANIYYTVDGTEPSATSTLYSKAFAITADTTVKAIAIKGDKKSAVTTYNAVYVGMYQSFSELVAEGEKAEGTVEGPITAVYQNGQYLYVVDSKNYPMLVYGTINTTLNNGDQIASVKGTYSPYNGLPEVTSPTLGAITSGSVTVEPQPLNALPTADLVNRYVVLNNVSNIEVANGKNYNSTFAGQNLTIYSQFLNVAIPTDSKIYNVTGFVAIFNSNVQVYPVKFEEVVEANQVETPVISYENNTVTITCATADAKIYYTTNGNDPEAGDDEYTAPFEITEDVTVKAIAVKEGMTNSYVASQLCTYVNPNATEAMFNFEQPSSLNSNYSDDDSVTEVLLTDATFTKSNITITFSNGSVTGTNVPKLFLGTGSGINSGWAFRFYNGTSFTVQAAEGYDLESIDFYGSNLGKNWSYSNGDLATGQNNTATWTPVGNTSNVTISKTATGDNPVIKTMTVKYVKGNPSGINDVIEAAEEGEAVYFNLQGQRVSNPERGIFVKVLNGKATKVVK